MRVLGLDISKDVVACVEIESAFGRFEIRETHEGPVAEQQDPVATASRLLESLAGKPGRVVTPAPVEIGTFRNIQVATRDKKAIRAALNFELEDDLPFESENLHYDYAALTSTEPGTLVHVGAVRKDSFESHLAGLQASGIDPDVITTDAWAYRCLFSRFHKPLPGQNGAGPVLLIGLERHKTFFYVNGRNRPVLYREIPFGLANIEQKLESQMSATRDELRSWVQDIGVTGINEEVSNVIGETLEILVPEIKQTELAARSQLKEEIEQILITGEGALMPGILEWIEAAARIPCALFRPLSALSTSQIAYSELSEVRFARALALATTLIPADKIPALNLRKGPFSKASASGDSPLEILKKPLPYLLMTAFVFFATKLIETNYYQSRLADVDTQVKRAVKSYYGDISDSAARSYLSNPEKLRKTISGEIERERELSKLFAPNKGSPANLLRSLSEKIGKDVVVDLVSFDAGSDNVDAYVENQPLKVSLSFVVANPQILSRLGDIVEKNFGLKRGNSEEITREGRKMLRVIFSGTVGGGK